MVVGGGIHGAAAAWEAAHRGLRTALVERDDFGCGVSWNSLKTIHGGLRYLQSADLVRVRESVRERRALLRIAPRLVKPLAFLVPTRGHGRRGREALACALLLNDLLSADRNRGVPAANRIPRGRMLGVPETLARVPGLSGAGLSGGALFHDAQVESSERLTVAFAHAAASAGALLANHAEAAGLLRAGDRVAGVLVRDGLQGRELEVRARFTLNLAGPGALDLLAAASLPAPRPGLLRATNLVFARPARVAQGVGAQSGGRFLFLVPWRDRTLVGTAYEPASEPETPGSARAFLAEAQAAFPWAGLREADVAVVHRGLVPGEGDAMGLRSRPLVVDHDADGTAPGLLTVVGVKYTTARGVAEAAVDRVARALGRTLPPSRSALLPLPRARPLEGALEARAREAVREEMALRLDDALARRLDLATAGPPSAADVATVARVMAEELGWDVVRARVEAERVAGARRHTLE